MRYCKYTLITLVMQLCGLILQSRDFRIMFYNTENYFDTFDDKTTLDQEFLPQGKLKWTDVRFRDKRDKSARVIIEANDGVMPDLIGLCEIENRFVLEELIDETPLDKYGYEIVHKDSPDPRGIDVALLYRKSGFKVISEKYIPMSTDTLNALSREILYVKGLVHNTDTLHVFVNHWPSKRDGAKKSEPKRMAAALALRSVIDSIQKSTPGAAICAMGDFNDYPDSRPISEGLRAMQDMYRVERSEIYSISLPLKKQGEGSIKYKGKWELVDLFFVSGSLLDKSLNIYCSAKDVMILKKDFMLEKTVRKGAESKMPRRTYKGNFYNGGYSDHLPVCLNLKINQPKNK